MPKTAIKPDIHAKFLADIIKHDTGARVVFGRTNGEVVLHVNLDKRAATIRSAADWASCKLNQDFIKAERARKESNRTTVERELEVDGLQDAIRNREAI